MNPNSFTLAVLIPLYILLLLRFRWLLRNAIGNIYVRTIAAGALALFIFAIIFFVLAFYFLGYVMGDRATPHH